MAGIRYLYITEDLKVIKVPIPKGSAFKAVRFMCGVTIRNRE